MSQYKLDYIALHNVNGKPIGKAQISLKDYVPALRNPLIAFVFKRRVALDAKALLISCDGRIPFDFFINRARHYEILYVEVPKGFRQAMEFYISTWKALSK